jgi:transcriptional regulator with XRE-family HTH domain
VELKDWVREARKHKGWTQEQLGEAMGVTKGNVSGWENGRHQPSWPQMVKIEEATGFPIRTHDQMLGYRNLIPSATPSAGEPRAAFGMEPILAWEHPDDLPDGEFVMVPRLDVHLSAGGGASKSRSTW